MGVKYNKGAIEIASTIKPSGSQPLDNRTIVENYSDLLTASTFSNAVYEGMKVFVLETKKWYTLKDTKNINDINSWEEMLYKKDLNAHINNEQHITDEERKSWNKAKSDIDAFLFAAESGETALDTLKELQAYIDSDESGVTIMIENITEAQNTADNAITEIDKITEIIGSGLTNVTLTEALSEIDIITANALTDLEIKTDKTNENFISLNNEVQNVKEIVGPGFSGATLTNALSELINSGTGETDPLLSAEIALIKENYITGVTNDNDYVTLSKDDKNNIITNVIVGNFANQNGLALTNDIKDYVSNEISDKVDTDTYTAYTAATETAISDAKNAAISAATVNTKAQIETLNSTISGASDDERFKIEIKQINGKLVHPIPSSAITLTNIARNSDLTTHTSNTDIHVTTDEKAKWNKVNDKIDTTAYTEYVNSINVLIEAQNATIQNLTKRIEELEAMLANGTIINADNISQFAVVDVVSVDEDITINKENGKVSISLNGVSNENFNYLETELITEQRTNENGEVTLKNLQIASGDTIVVYDDNEKIIAEHVIIDEEIQNSNVKIITK